MQSVKVTPSVYLMGLSDSEQDKPKNLRLLERDWFDIAMVYNNRRRAILALEKGAAGARASFFYLGTERAARVSSTSITARTIRSGWPDHDESSLPLGCSTRGTIAAPSSEPTRQGAVGTCRQCFFWGIWNHRGLNEKHCGTGTHVCLRTDQNAAYRQCRSRVGGVLCGSSGRGRSFMLQGLLRLQHQRRWIIGPPTSRLLRRCQWDRDQTGVRPGVLFLSLQRRWVEGCRASGVLRACTRNSTCQMSGQRGVLSALRSECEILRRDDAFERIRKAPFPLGACRESGRVRTAIRRRRSAEKIAARTHPSA